MILGQYFISLGITYAWRKAWTCSSTKCRPSGSFRALGLSPKASTLTALPDWPGSLLTKALALRCFKTALCKSRTLHGSIEHPNHQKIHRKTSWKLSFLSEIAASRTKISPKKKSVIISHLWDSLIKEISYINFLLFEEDITKIGYRNFSRIDPFLENMKLNIPFRIP